MAPPILFQHGMFAHHGVFDAWVRYFAAAGFECHAPSLPGRNPTDEERLRHLTMAENLEALVAARERISEPPIVIGHSMGGLLAQQLAAKSACAALVLVASSPPGVLWAHPRALRYLLALMPTILIGKPLRPSDKTLRAVVFNALEEEEAQQLSSAVVPDSGRAFRSQVLGTLSIPGAVRCPVLVLSGERDINGSPGIPGRLAKRYNGRHHVIRGADHWIVAPSRVESVCPLILDWLRELGIAQALGAGPVASDARAGEAARRSAPPAHPSRSRCMRARVVSWLSSDGPR